MSAGTETIMRSEGTTPTGAANEEQASRWVRGMFGRVAGRYDLMNRLMSGSLDQYWRRRLVARVVDVLNRPHAIALDLACGTGDVTIGLERASGVPAIGMDFCHPMLVEARKKFDRSHRRSSLAEADGLQLPLRNNAVDVVTIAFGFRNFTNYRRGLVEMLRVLKPGGVAAILELSTPPNKTFASLYNAVSRRAMASLGGLITGSRDAYEYLPESIRKFPVAEELAGEMRDVGYDSVRFERLTFGIVALHLGTKSRD